MGPASVSIIGFILGLMFPTTVNHTACVLPHRLVNGTVGWMAACGGIVCAPDCPNPLRNP